ncbi:MAG: hypothetical protein KDD60_09905, partial [Bdellovibrionales bacterium]|nr:hypothetical protein [Bdellovibrionales bacterium]
MNESSRHQQPPEQSPALRYGHYDFVGPEGLPPTSIERYLRRYLGNSFQLLYRVVDDETVSINADEETVELLLVANGSLSCKFSRSPSESTDLGSGDCVVMLSGETVVFERKSGTAATVV